MPGKADQTDQVRAAWMLHSPPSKKVLTFQEGGWVRCAVTMLFVVSWQCFDGVLVVLKEWYPHVCVLTEVVHLSTQKKTRQRKRETLLLGLYAGLIHVC